MANGILSFSMLDYSGEKSTMQIQTGAITATSLPGTLTAVGNIRVAIEGITLGTVSNEQLMVFSTPLGSTPPASVDAQRERKWLVVYEDTTEFFDPGVNAIPNAGYRKKFTLEIPTADYTGRLLPGTDLADQDNPEIQAFVSEFEALARSPYGGGVNVLSISAVGRNL